MPFSSIDYYHRRSSLYECAANVHTPLAAIIRWQRSIEIVLVSLNFCPARSPPLVRSSFLYYFSGIIPLLSTIRVSIRCTYVYTALIHVYTDERWICLCHWRSMLHAFTKTPHVRPSRLHQQHDNNVRCTHRAIRCAVHVV